MTKLSVKVDPKFSTRHVMWRILASILIMCSSNSFARVNYEDSPTKMHDLRKLKETTLAVTIKYATNVQEVCEKESRRRGNKGFNYELESCAFWTEDTCTVVLPKKANLHTIGHEFLHCIKGDWHPQ